MPSTTIAIIFVVAGSITAIVGIWLWCRIKWKDYQQQRVRPYQQQRVRPYQQQRVRPYLQEKKKDLVLV